MMLSKEDFLSSYKTSMGMDPQKTVLPMQRIIRPFIMLSVCLSPMALALPLTAMYPVFDFSISELLNQTQFLQEQLTDQTDIQSGIVFTDDYVVIQAEGNLLILVNRSAPYTSEDKTLQPEAKESPVTKPRLRLQEEREKAHLNSQKLFLNERVFHWHLSTDIPRTIDESQPLMDKLEANIVDHLRANDLQPHLYVFTGTTLIKHSLAFIKRLCKKLWYYSYEEEATDEMCKPVQHDRDAYLYTSSQAIGTLENIVISMVPLKPYWTLNSFSLDLANMKKNDKVQDCTKKEDSEKEKDCLNDTLYAYALAFKAQLGGTWIKHMLVSSYDDQLFYLQRKYNAPCLNGEVLNRQTWQKYSQDRLAPHFKKALGSSESMVVIAHSLSDVFHRMLDKFNTLSQHKNAIQQRRQQGFCS